MKTLCVFDPRTNSVKTVPVYDNNTYWIVDAAPCKINPLWETQHSCPVSKVNRRHLPDDIKRLGKHE